MPWLNYPVNRVCFNLPSKNRKREGLCQHPWLSLIWFFWFSKEFMDEPVQFWLVKLEIYNSVAIFNCLNPHENFPHVGLGSQKLVCQKPKLLISQSEMAINFKSINYLEFWRKCFVGCRVFARKMSRLFVLRFLVTHDYLLHLPNFFMKTEEDSGHKVWVNGPVYRNMILSFLLTVQIILNDAEEIMIKENCSNTLKFFRNFTLMIKMQMFFCNGMFFPSINIPKMLSCSQFSSSSWVQ